MKVRENEKARRQVLDLLLRRNKPYSRGKWHVSKMVNCMRAAYFWRKGVKWIPPDLDGLQLIFARGRAHHGVLEVYDVAEKEVEKDGVVGHIDTIGDRITEIFTTTLSMNRVKHPASVPRVFSIKIEQLKCYLYMEDETEGDLMVFYLFGDYSRDPTIMPDLKVYTLEFEEDQLELNWKYRLKRNEVIDEMIEMGEVPEQKGEDFECLNCGYSYLCENFLEGDRLGDVMDKVNNLKDEEDVVL